MSKPQFRKIKRQLPSSSNLVLSNNAMLTSTWSKLLARVSTTSSYSNWFQVVSTNWYLNENWDVFSYNHSFYPSPSPPLPVFSSSSPSSCCYLVLVRFSPALSLSFSNGHRITFSNERSSRKENERITLRLSQTAAGREARSVTREKQVVTWTFEQSSPTLIRREKLSLLDVDISFRN